MDDSVRVLLRLVEFLRNGRLCVFHFRPGCCRQFLFFRLSEVSHFPRPAREEVTRDDMMRDSSWFATVRWKDSPIVGIGSSRFAMLVLGAQLPSIADVLHFCEHVIGALFMGHQVRVQASPVSSRVI